MGRCKDNGRSSSEAIVKKPVLQETTRFGLRGLRLERQKTGGETLGETPKQKPPTNRRVAGLGTCGESQETGEATYEEIPKQKPPTNQESLLIRRN